MKKIIFLSLFFSLSIFNLTAQSYDLDVQTVNASEIDFAAFLYSNLLSGAPRVFAVRISPEGGAIKVKGEIYWDKEKNGNFEWLFRFVTKSFEARSFFNTELGNSIPIKRTATADLIEENRRRGKPTGVYELRISILDPVTEDVIVQTEDPFHPKFEFSNPSQNLTIRLPEPGSIQNIGGVYAEWDALTGIEYYEVLAREKRNRAQSLEDAIASGDPIIDNVNVGLANSIDLRSILTREWLPGQEIVVQVYALPVGATPSQKIESNIVNFYLDDPSNPTKEVTSDEMTRLLQMLQDNLGSDLLDRLLNGNVNIETIISEETGLALSPEEIIELLDYLRQNPDNLISIEQD